MGNSTVDAEQHHFRHIESCLNYQAYIYRIDPSITASRYMAVCQRLSKLGITKEERMGVIYVYARWGFCIIPHHGFPDLRLNFYHDTAVNDIKGVMVLIHTAFETSDVAANSGDLHA